MTVSNESSGTSWSHDQAVRARELAKQASDRAAAAQRDLDAARKVSRGDPDAAAAVQAAQKRAAAAQAEATRAKLHADSFAENNPALLELQGPAGEQPDAAQLQAYRAAVGMVTEALQVPGADEAQLLAEARQFVDSQLQPFLAANGSDGDTEALRAGLLTELGKPENVAALATAMSVGPQATGVTPPELPAPPEPSKLEAALDWSLTQQGAPYVGAASPFRFGDRPGDGRTYQGGGQHPYVSPAGVIGYDCSGFVVAVFRKAGVDLVAHGMSSSGGYKSGLPAVEKDQLQPGDLLTKDGHVVIYIGDNKVIESTPPGVKVSDASKFINDSSYVGRRVPPEWYGGTAEEQASVGAISGGSDSTAASGFARTAPGATGTGNGGGTTAPRQTSSATGGSSAARASHDTMMDAWIIQLLNKSGDLLLAAIAGDADLSSVLEGHPGVAEALSNWQPGQPVPPEVSTFLSDTLGQAGITAVPGPDGKPQLISADGAQLTDAGGLEQALGLEPGALAGRGPDFEPGRSYSPAALSTSLMTIRG
ncbi:MAG: C40 family peptidase [Archangiaceae bacterium]|nr:C40 family peptidase [Archangiaceae bacterium]